MTQNGADTNLVTQAEYARHQGVSQSAVSQWINVGRITVKDGFIDVAAADKAIEETSGESRGARPGVKKAKVETLQSNAGTMPLASNVGGTLIQARTTEAQIRAKMQTIEYRERIGELVERVKCDKAIADALLPIMAALDSVSARIGPAVAGETDVRRVQNLIDAGINDIRHDLADTLRRMIDGSSGTRQ